MKKRLVCWWVVLLCLSWGTAAAAEFPDGNVGTFTDAAFLVPTSELHAGVTIATHTPAVDIAFFDVQTYPGNPWSVWGDGLAVGDRYYTSIGDHLAPEGNAFVYVYDTTSKKLRLLTDLRSVLKRPEGWYTPGKIHSRIDQGKDGWLYFSTHRGSTRATVAENHFSGGWILRCHPETGVCEVVAEAPLPNQTLPTSVLDPDRMLYYAGTADGDYKNKQVQFLVYDVAKRTVLYSDDAGPYRYLIFARSSGRVYFHRDGKGGGAKPLVRFDPAKPGPPQEIDAAVGLRAATQETRKGKVYTVDRNALWEFDTRKESARLLGELTAGNEDYIASIDLDPHTERYLYYVPGAHGGGYKDGAPLLQYDLKTSTVKVIAFLHPAIEKETGFIPMGTYATAVSPKGDKVYITWHGNRGGKERGKLRFNTCALTVVHVPAAERKK
jgi:DNA-binding beta-propeller fold protein YncE